MTTYLYVGSSTDRQDIGEQAQALVNKYPYDIVVREPNADPGEKPKLNRLLKRLKSGDRLIVHDISRLGRSISAAAKISGQLAAQGVMLVVDNLEFACNPAVDIYTLIASAAQMDKDLLTDRQAIGIAKAKAKGKYKGRKAISPSVVKKARALIAKGIKKKDVARQLNIGESTLYKYLAARRD
ncbi:recombinase family protein [Alteromonas gilva]|uniref:Recombinase family protein n=1 Tax=Alteromonas gilva TaxID=2987522 RepID=A0ABT5L4Z9_9ALTE|nr:recombinase family protein [Alteromonas gilva]MDC8831943.1 recombinase family protein [Alteromonas gilva]